VGGNHGLGVQVDGIEDLNLAGGHAARIGQIAVLRGGGEGAQALGIARRVADGVHHLHVLDVVDVQRLLQAHDQSLAIELHRQNCVCIRVIADLALLLEVAHL